MTRLVVNDRRTTVPGDARPGPDVPAFHRRLGGYGRTDLSDVPELAAGAGVARVLVKAETGRFGLPAFKALGPCQALKALQGPKGLEGPQGPKGLRCAKRSTRPETGGRIRQGP